MKRVTKTITISIAFILLIPIIVFIIFLIVPKDDWYTVEKFGNNYELEVVSRDNYNIVYRIKNKSNYVINENIIEYNFNDKWIIAKSKKNSSLELTLTDKGYAYLLTTKPDSITNNYWIIDKSIPINLNDSNTFVRLQVKDYFYLIVKSGLTGPLDSLDFYSFLKARNIDIKFKEREK